MAPCRGASCSWALCYSVTSPVAAVKHSQRERCAMKKCEICNGRVGPTPETIRGAKVSHGACAMEEFSREDPSRGVYADAYAEACEARKEQIRG